MGLNWVKGTMSLAQRQTGGMGQVYHQGVWMDDSR